MPSRPIPHDDAAESEVLASVLLFPQVVAVRVLTTLTSADFYTPRNQRWFIALAQLHERGEKIDTTGCISELQRLGDEEPRWLVAAINESGASRDPTHGMRVVAETSLRRRLMSEAGALNVAALDMKLDPGEVLDSARASFASIDSPLTGREPDDMDIEEFLTQVEAEPVKWVIPGILGEGWRTVVVAREGQGKTWLLRQMAVCSAFGIHPLTHRPMEPVRTMLMDLENPADHARHSLGLLVRQARRMRPDAEPVQRLWARPGGIDLRRRADRAEVETLLQKRRPELVVMGPLYKTYRARGDSWDVVASEVQDIMDDWRTRFGIAMLIEDHAPKGQELVPFGSSLWLRWPEVGLALHQEANESLSVKRWRGDRMPTEWPEVLLRSSPWPWEGVWPQRYEAEDAF